MAKGILLGNNNNVLFEDAQARTDLSNKIQVMTESAWNALTEETKATYATKKVLTLITSDPEPETSDNEDETSENSDPENSENSDPETSN